jgi:diaminohydroxyphosphoribosylaminopyrimidine deaminase / 5-amino-6-(5-phosphoribosylamino)uracil reductase
VLVSGDGQLLADGYSRETDATAHAEEAALVKLAAAGHNGGLADATLYSTLEPCAQRASRPISCAQLIINAGIGRVVLAWREPALLVAVPQGAELLSAADVAVVELPELAASARSMNAHLLQP